MKTGELLEERQARWSQLEALCDQLESSPRTLKQHGDKILQFSALYRSACSDLAMADILQLPLTTVNYLHRLVGRAHNQLYRSQSFQVSTWVDTIFNVAPKQIFSDWCVQLAAILFFGLFITCAHMAANEEAFPGFAEAIVGTEAIKECEKNFADPPMGNLDHYVIMAAFYIRHNTGIGLQCFGLGPLIIPSLFTLGYNAVQLGTLFGYMARPEVDSGANFFHFVTAHGPFELTAIALSGGAGLRLGVGLLLTAGFRRIDSFRLHAVRALPVIFAAAILFFLAAFTEGFISPSPLPYVVKTLWAIGSTGAMLFYFVLLGFPSQAAERSS
ncbi:MAG: stage II sporulation protein M [Pirellulales bacterium]